jgi:hypothetical protein
MSLSGLWRDQGKVKQAGKLLPTVYGWFTEGFDTRNLMEAKTFDRPYSGLLPDKQAYAKTNS